MEWSLYLSRTEAIYLIANGHSGTGNINSDPQFVRKPDPGLDKMWGTADDDYGDLRLLPTSPCIDAGKNSAVPVGVTTDWAGNPRFADVPAIPDTGSGTAPIVDLGAYESPTLLIAGANGANDFTLGLTPDHASIQIVSPGGTNTYLAWPGPTPRYGSPAGRAATG